MEYDNRLVVTKELQRSINDGEHSREDLLELFVDNTANDSIDQI